MSQTRNTLISQSSSEQSVHPSAKLAVFWLPVPPNVVSSSSSPTDPTNFQREPTVSDQNSRARLLGCHTPHTALAWPTHHHHSIVGRTRRFGIPSSGVLGPARAWPSLRHRNGCDRSTKRPPENSMQVVSVCVACMCMNIGIICRSLYRNREQLGVHNYT